MSPQINIQNENRETHVHALILDHHYEYPLPEVASKTPTLEFKRVETVFDGYFLRDYMKENAVCELLDRIVINHPQAPHSAYDEGDWGVHVHRIYANCEGHTSIIKALVQLMVEELLKVSGDDDFFDYFPNTVEAIYDYAHSLGLEDLLEPLTTVVFAEDSPYAPEGDSNDARRYFSYLPNAPKGG